MYNKKCINTFLLILALVGLITLIIPFMNVCSISEYNLVVKIFYYIFIVIFALCDILIIILGIINLFKNNFKLTPIQEMLSYIALISLLLNTLIVLPIKNVSVSVGYSIVLLETFVMACFNEIFKLIRKMPRTLKLLKGYLDKIYAAKKEKKEKAEQKRKQEEENKNNNHQLKLNLDNEDGKITITEDIEEVKIIPPDEEIV